MRPLRSILTLFMLAILVFSCTTTQDATPVKALRQDFWMNTDATNNHRYLVKVLLPEDYYQQPNTVYPVVYLTDADWLFGLGSDRSLFIANSSQEIILVGIAYGSEKECWEKRSIDFESGLDENEEVGAEKYLQFVTNELIPRVESMFRADPNNRTLITWSMGGDIAASAMGQENPVFQNYVVGGYTFSNDWFEAVASLQHEEPIKLYMARGEYDRADELKQNVDRFKQLNPPGIELKWDILEGRWHEYSAVADVVIHGLDYVFGKVMIAPLLKEVVLNKGVDAAIARYHELKTNDPDEYLIERGQMEWLLQMLDEEGWKKGREALVNLMEAEFPLDLVNLTFVVNTTNPPPSEPVYVVGSFNSWDPAATAMEKQEDGSWQCVVQVPRGSHQEYKFTRGSWDTEAAATGGRKLANSRLEVASDTLVTRTVKCWVDKGEE